MTGDALDGYGWHARLVEVSGRVLATILPGARQKHGLFRRKRQKNQVSSQKESHDASRKTSKKPQGNDKTSYKMASQIKLEAC